MAHLLRAFAALVEPSNISVGNLRMFPKEEPKRKIFLGGGRDKKTFNH